MAFVEAFGILLARSDEMLLGFGSHSCGIDVLRWQAPGGRVLVMMICGSLWCGDRCAIPLAYG